jgi:hypothetical protein
MFTLCDCTIFAVRLELCHAVPLSYILLLQVVLQLSVVRLSKT